MKEQPVLLMRGDPGELNDYRSFPPFRTGPGLAGDFPFDEGTSGAYNATRYINPEDEAWFEREPAEIHHEINHETLSFVDALGGRHA